MFALAVLNSAKLYRVTPSHVLMIYINKVFVHKVMTHREYDDWNKLYRKGKV